MPTYQYACTACGEQHEAVQTFTDAPLTDCPACGGRLRKVFSAVGVVFKGSGFYKNDSRGTAGKGKDAAAGDKGESGSKDGKDGGGKDGAAPKKDAPASTPASSGSGGGSSSGSGGGSSGGASGGSSSGGTSAPAAKSA